MDTTKLSQKQMFMALPRHKQQAFIDALTDEEAEALINSWEWEARPQQLEPEGDWFCWLILAGRGFGKTRTASEWIVSQIKQGKMKRVALIGRTAADVRDIMIEGVSGILAIAELRGIKAYYEPSKRRVTFENGAVCIAYSAEEPKLLRGPEHDGGWLDEAASFPPPKSGDDNDAYGNFIMGLRLGEKPRFIVTTTPRPTKLIKQLVADDSTHVTRGSTYDNKDNLAGSFLAEIERRYEGTRIGQQELHGVILEDVEGALWDYDLINAHRILIPKDMTWHQVTPQLQRIVVTVDPAVSTSATSDYTALCVAGLGYDDHVYILHSTHMKASPSEWAREALSLFDRYNADRIIAERNNGGDMVEHTIRTIDRNAPIKTIHAKRGKETRAEPVVAMYEQGKVHHVGPHDDLEAEMVVFPIDKTTNDDMVDAMVYAVTDLAGLHQKTASPLITFSGYRQRR